MGRKKAVEISSEEHLMLLHEKIINKDSLDHLTEWVKDLGYDMGRSSIGRYAQEFNKKIEAEKEYKALSEEEKRLVWLYRNMNKQKRELLLHELFFEPPIGRYVFCGRYAK